MSAPGLDRLATNGFYGAANTRFSVISTHGWYDHELILLHTTTAERRTHATTETRRAHEPTATRRTHDIEINEP